MIGPTSRGSTCRRMTCAGAEPGQPRRLHVRLAADRAGDAAGHPQQQRAADDAEHDHGRGAVAGEHRQHHQQHDDPGQRQQQVGDPADGPVQPAAEVAGQHAEGDAEDREHDHGLDHRDQRDLAAVQQPGQHVPAEPVGTEPVRRARSGQRVGEVLELRVGRRPPRCAHAGDREHDQVPAGEQTQPPAPQRARPPGAPAAAGGRGSGVGGDRRGGVRRLGGRERNDGHRARTLGLSHR